MTALQVAMIPVTHHVMMSAVVAVAQDVVIAATQHVHPLLQAVVVMTKEMITYE